jgi:peroxiredoxin Q/BCP
MTHREVFLRRVAGLALGLAGLMLAGCGDCGSCGGSITVAPSDSESDCSEGACTLATKSSEGDCSECCAEASSSCPVAGKCCVESGRAAVLAASAAVEAEEASLTLADEPKNTEAKVGDVAPAFEATDDQGKTFKSSDHFGKKVVVLYFYPADFTGGCTKQACGFRDDYQKLADKGVEVIGVSGDSAKTHALFKKHHKLTFTLLADEDGALAKKFGVPTKPGGEFKTQVDGQDHVFKRGVSAARWTFVIDKNGKIAYKNTKVNAAEDSKEIIKVVEGLK